MTGRPPPQIKAPAKLKNQQLQPHQLLKPFPHLPRPEGESQTRSPTRSRPREPHGAAQRLRTRLGGSRAWEPREGNGTEQAQYRLVHDAAPRRFAGTRGRSRPAGQVLGPPLSPSSAHGAPPRPLGMHCPARAAVGGLRGCLGDEQCSAWTGLPPPTPAPGRLPGSPRPPARPPGATCTAALWAPARRAQLWALSPDAVS